MSYLSELRSVWGSSPLISVGVSVLIQDEAGRILLQRRGDDGLWGVVGGGLEPGESFVDAAHRELREETGLTCPDLAPLPLEEALVSGPEFYHRYPNGHEIYLVGMRTHGTLPAAALAHAAPDDSGETLELRWFALDDLPPLSSNINRANMNVLRLRAGLPALPLFHFPEAPPHDDHLARLRAAVGPRPLFAPGASVLVEDGRGRLLLLRHARTGQWVLPGGKLHPGESFEACARRELAEETGGHAGQLTPVQLLQGPEFRYKDTSGPWDSVGVLYRAEGVTGEITLPEGEITGARWWAADEVAGADLLGLYTRRAVEAWREGQTTPASHASLRP
ncbi:NUDIX domain-containing protein [Deinococcus sp. SDU3-2]|uniref:NUDIX domain-containing protein n=1 Tax=Deinococcus terrestris TaxID=2651870 RepID=A0A7X1NXE2_9DEIO|nr:NUDIX domain-containing protein [Deinococcus terrestris]MPY67577.1 NUDIX domain-containing protein [Deinococcus terrestris]